MLDDWAELEPKPKWLLKLEPKRLAIVAFPFLVIVVSFSLVLLAGTPQGPLARALVENGHAEAAGRWTMLATWLLLLTVGIACVGYFFWNLRLFEDTTRRWLIGAFLILAAIGVGTVLLGAAEGPWLMGEKAVCAAFGPRPAATEADDVAPADGNLASYRSPSNGLSEDSRFLRGPQCVGAPDGRMTWMWWLNLVQRVLLALVSPALVLGTIACLAEPLERSPPGGQMAADRLRTHLYLTAVLFVSGLLFLSALLRWPAFAFAGTGHTSYVAHVDALILYWGVTYSLYIASYYVPVALLLTAEGKRDGIAADKLPAGQLLDWTKTLAALFAPAIVGLLGSVLHL